jgi:hypothetical protein
VDLLGDCHVAIHCLVHGLELDLLELAEDALPQLDDRVAAVDLAGAKAWNAKSSAMNGASRSASSS